MYLLLTTFQDNQRSHCAQTHENDCISFVWLMSVDWKVVYQRRTFKVKGCEIKGNKNALLFNSLNGKLQVPIKSSQCESPVRKVLRINTPTKSVHRQLYSETYP